MQRGLGVKDGECKLRGENRVKRDSRFQMILQRDRSLKGKQCSDPFLGKLSNGITEGIQELVLLGLRKHKQLTTTQPC